MSTLSELMGEVAACRRCDRLVEWRERVARDKRAAYADEDYWGRAVPSFGDPQARIVVLGLAPAAHGANRTGRMFTGDRSGDWLFRAMHRAGLANQAESVSIDDGLELDDAWVTAPVRCAPPQNRPTLEERANCAPFLTRELALLPRFTTMVCLGGIGWNAAIDHFGVRPRPKFGHGVEFAVPGGPNLIGCYHVSQQNTFTGRLTEVMLDDIFARAIDLADSLGKL